MIRRNGLEPAHEQAGALSEAGIALELILDVLSRRPDETITPEQEEYLRAQMAKATRAMGLMADLLTARFVSRELVRVPAEVAA